MLASSMGCRMRLRALMNLPRGDGDALISHHVGHTGGVGDGENMKVKPPLRRQ